MFLRVVSGAPGNDRFDAAHGSLVGDARAAFADAPRDRPQESFAPASSFRKLTARTSQFPEIVALGCQGREQWNRRVARIVHERLVRNRERLGDVSFGQCTGILVRLRIFDR
jgi:hypothetical protein